MERRYATRQAKKNFLKVIDTYNKTGDTRHLAKGLIKLTIYMAWQVEEGPELTYLDDLPEIVETLKSLDIKLGSK
jgi:hypothetical protein